MVKKAKKTKMKKQIKNIYSKYLYKYAESIFHVLQKGPYRFTEAKSIPVSENYNGMSIIETYNMNNLSLKPSFCLKEPSQEKYLKLFPDLENLEKRSLEVGIVSASKVSVIPGYFPIWEGKIFEEVTHGGFSKLSDFNMFYYWLKYELKLIFSKKKSIHKEAIYIYGPFPDNYFHWIIQMLPKIRIIENNNKYRELPIVISQNAKQFVKESLEIVGYSDKVIFLEEGVYEFDKLHICTTIHNGCTTYPSTTEWIQSKFIKQDNQHKNKKRRLYISRQDSKLRQVTNEVELKPILEAYGFEIVILSNYSIQDKVKMFQEAEIIIGSSGAGFTQQVFVSENTVVIEIFREKESCRHFYQYYILALCMKQIHGFLAAPKDGDGIRVEPEKMKEIIELGLSYLQ